MRIIADRMISFGPPPKELDEETKRYLLDILVRQNKREQLLFYSTIVYLAIERF